MLDSLKRASVVCKMRRKWLFVTILLKSSEEAEPALFRVSGSIRSSVGRIFFARLDEENLLILVAKIETILHKGRENGGGIGMAALGQPLDDFIFIVKRGVAQLPSVARKVAYRSATGHIPDWHSGWRAAAQEEPPLRASPEEDLFHL